MVDGSFHLLVLNIARMAHCDAIGVEPSTPSDKCELVASFTGNHKLMWHKAGATRREQRFGAN